MNQKHLLWNEPCHIHSQSGSRNRWQGRWKDSYTNSFLLLCSQHLSLTFSIIIHNNTLQWSDQKYICYSCSFANVMMTYMVSHPIAPAMYTIWTYWQYHWPRQSALGTKITTRGRATYDTVPYDCTPTRICATKYLMILFCLYGTQPYEGVRRQ